MQHPTTDKRTTSEVVALSVQQAGRGFLSREFIFGALGFVVFVTAITLFINAVGVEALQGVIRDSGPLAALAYVALKALTYVFAPLTSGPIQVFAGTLFDSVWVGVLYTLIGEVIGGSISFLIARYLGRPVVARLVGEQGIRQVDEFSDKYLHGWQSLAAARILLFAFWDFLSYGAGLVNIRFRTYVSVSFVAGSLPTLVFVGLGNTIVNNPAMLLLVYVGVALLIGLSLWFRKPLLRLLARLRRDASA